MQNPLRHLLFGLIAALLLLQPAVRAGAACASSLFTGTCPCTAAADEPDAGESDCCAPSHGTDDSSESGGSKDTSSDPSKCGCVLKSAPELAAAPRTASVGAGQPTVLEQIQVAFVAVLPELLRVRAVEAPRPPGRDFEFSSARAPTTARRLALLQVSRR